VELLRPVQPHDPDRAVGLDLQHGRNAGRAHGAGSPRMRWATRLRWICEVPPMTLCARLYRYTFNDVSSQPTASAACPTACSADVISNLSTERSEERRVGKQFTGPLASQLSKAVR